MSIVYPAWVPRTVQILADVLPKHEIKDRLLTHPDMEEVWATLLTSSVDADAYNAIWKVQSLECWGLSDIRFSLSEKAAAAMLGEAMAEFRSDHIVRSSFINEEVAAWKSVASRCRSIWQVDNAPFANPALATSLEIVAAHFDALSERFSNLSGPRVLNRAGRNKNGDIEIQLKRDLIRARSASMIAFSDAIYKKKHLKTLSIFCSVGLDEDVSPKDVENYRGRLRS